MKPVAIITGAASGIGCTIALRLRELGYQSVCFDIREPDPSLDLAFQICDVSSETEVTRAYKVTKNRYGPCQVLVSNSGLQYMAPVEDFPLEKWNQLIGVMLTGSFLMARAVIPDMKSQKFGRIVHVNSIHGKIASPFKSAYVAAKHGVLGLSRVLAKELAAYGITVNSICPGFVDTPLMRNQMEKQMQLNNLSEDEVLDQVFLVDQEIKQLTQPEDIAKMLEFLISKNASTITGEALNISGGWGMGL